MMAMPMTTIVYIHFPMLASILIKQLEADIQMADQRELWKKSSHTYDSPIYLCLRIIR